MSEKISSKPCPICRQMMVIVGATVKGEKITSCGHQFKFKQTKSQKDMGRRYIQQPWGLELVTGSTFMDELEKSSVEMQDAIIALVEKKGV